MEDVIPLEIEAGEMMDLAKSKKEDLDIEDLVDNIADIATGGYL